MAVLLITHDLNLVRRFAQRIAVMEKGVLVESGPVEQVFASPQHPYTQRLLASRPQRTVRAGAADFARAARSARDLGRFQNASCRASAAGSARDGFAAVADVERVACARARRSASSANRVRANRRWRWPARPAAHRARRDRVPGQGARQLSRRRTDRACARTCRSSSRIRSARFRRARRSSGSSAKGSRCTGRNMTPQARRDKVIVGAARSRPRPHGAAPLSARILRRAAPADRDCARAGAGAAHPGPRRTDQRARRFDSAAGAETARRICSRSTTSASSSSATIWRSSGRWRIASRSCKTVRSSKRGEVEEIFATPAHPYTRKLLKAALDH